jgi:lipoyl synthase
VRPQAKYERSLEQIQAHQSYGKRTKSGIMVGLGETQEEVFQTMDDLLATAATCSPSANTCSPPKCTWT